LEASYKDHVTFGRVDFRAEKVAIVCNGPSLARSAAFISALRSAGVHIMAVNQVLAHISGADTWFTLDPCKRNAWIPRHPVPGVRYVMSVPDDYGSPRAACKDHRVEMIPGTTYIRRMAGNMFGSLRAKPGLSEDPRGVHTGNSGYGALGLAWLMCARRIAMLGIDGGGGGYAFGCGEPRNLGHLPALFSSAVPQLMARGVRVANASPSSRITCFERITPESLPIWFERS
jgi:hypothetical protein